MSQHYDFHQYSGPCFSALEPGDTFRFVNWDYTHDVKPLPVKLSDNQDFIMFRRNVVYTVISRRPGDVPEQIGRFTLLWLNGLSLETLL